MVKRVSSSEPSPLYIRTLKASREILVSFLLCAKHGTNLASESLATGIYRQV